MPNALPAAAHCIFAQYACMHKWPRDRLAEASCTLLRHVIVVVLLAPVLRTYVSRHMMHTWPCNMPCQMQLTSPPPWPHLYACTATLWQTHFAAALSCSTHCQSQHKAPSTHAQNVGCALPYHAIAPAWNVHCQEQNPGPFPCAQHYRKQYAGTTPM